MTIGWSQTLSAGANLTPFGTMLTASTGALTLADLRVEELLATTVTARVTVLRGFGLLDKPDLERYCATAGEILRWDFGSILDLVVHADPKNYLFDKGDVPFHWDGAFTDSVPRFFLFQCVYGSPEDGGETVFSDSTRVYREAPADLRKLWAATTVTYRTDKLAHYGGAAKWPLLGTHPTTGETTIRYAEPLDPDRYLNPLFLTVDGVAPQDGARVVADLGERLHDRRYCYHHAWRTGDIVVADNHALLHGRNAFTGAARRNLQRIQII